MDCQFDIGCEPMDRYSNRSWKFYSAIPSTGIGFFNVGRKVGKIGYDTRFHLHANAIYYPLGDISRNGDLWRSTIATSGDVLPAADFLVAHLVLGALVGNKPQETDG